MDPLIGASILTGGSSVVGGILGLLGQRSANKTNMEIARMNQQSVRETNKSNADIAAAANASNQLMQRQQNQWNLAQWQRENAYNSPAQQVQRLLAAGINPASVYGSVGNNNVASQLQSAPYSPAETSYNDPATLDYRQSPYDFSFIRDAAFTGVNAYQQAQMQQADVDIKREQRDALQLQNQYTFASMLDRLTQERNKAKYGSVEYEQASENLRLFKDVYDYQKRQFAANAVNAEKQSEELEVRIATAKIQRDLLSIDAKWSERLNQRQYQLLGANIQQAVSAARLSDASAVESSARKAVTDLQATGLKIDNKTKQDVQQFIVDKAREEVYAMEDARAYLPYDKYREYGGKGYTIFPFVTGQVKADEMRAKNVQRYRERLKNKRK